LLVVVVKHVDLGNHVAGLDLVNDLSKAQSDRDDSLDNNYLLEVPRIHEHAITVGYQGEAFFAIIVYVGYFLGEHEGRNCLYVVAVGILRLDPPWLSQDDDCLDMAVGVELLKTELRNVLKPDVHLIHLVLRFVLILKLHMQSDHVILFELLLFIFHPP
jgi:hypothetical protein